MHAPAPQTPTLAPADIRRIMVGLMLGMLLSALDMTIVGPALPTIGHELGHFDLLSWVVTSYLLVSTACTPLYGKLADIHGRRIMLLIALVAFVVGSIACALSPNLLALILARGLQGVGGGGIMAVSMTIIGDMVPPRERVKYQVYTSMVWVVSNIAGPVLGGYFAEHIHWSMIFWINVPIGIAAWLVLSKRLLLLPRHERPHALDVVGAVLLMIASVLLTLGLTWGGGRMGWTAPLVLGTFALSAVFWALVVWRLRTAEEPLIPLSVLKNKVVLRGTLSMSSATAAYIALSIYVPIYFQVVQHLDVSLSGLAMIPLMIGATIGSILGMRLMPYFKRYLHIGVGSMALSALASVPLILAPGSLSLWPAEACMFLIALGVGPLFPLTNVAIQSSVPLHELGTTTALVTFTRSLGSALGVAVIGTVIISGLTGPGGAGGDIFGSAVQQEGPKIASTFGLVFLIAAIAFVVASVGLSVVNEPPLDPKRKAAPSAASE